VATSFGSDFRRFFSRGLAAILPTVLTIALIVWLIQAIYKYIGQYIGSGTRWLIAAIWKVETKTLTQTWSDYHLDFVSFAIAIVLVYIVGRFVASFLGRTVWRSVESQLIRVPVIKQIYPSIKQVTDFLILNETEVKFSRVVAVEYPRKGVYSLGLVTNPGMQSLRRISDADLLTVFIPSSPTPITGYTITVRRDEVIDLPLTIEEAFRFTVSGGVVLPSVESMKDSSADLPADRQERLPAGASQDE